MCFSDNTSVCMYTHAHAFRGLRFSECSHSDHNTAPHNSRTRGDHRKADIVVYTLIRHTGEATMGLFHGLHAQIIHSVSHTHTQRMAIKIGTCAMFAMIPPLIRGEKFCALDSLKGEKKSGGNKRDGRQAGFLRRWQRLLGVFDKCE